MPVPWKGAAICAALVIGYPGLGQAQEASSSPDVGDTKMFSLRGFGTLALTHSGEDTADFVSSVYQNNGAGYTRNPDFGVDSRAGVQLDMNLAKNLTAVVQVVSERQYNGTFRPVVEWANVRYQISPDFSIRAGRVALPVFMASDYRKVGYSNTWLRPPADLYSLCPFTSNDGVDVSYRFHMGETTLTLQGAYGGVSANRPTLATGQTSWFKCRDGKLINAQLEYKALTVRANYVTQSMYLQGEAVDPIFENLRKLGAGIAPYFPTQGQAALDLAKTYEAHGKKTTLASIGATLDPGDWLVQGEWARRTSESFLADETAWYVNGGYRFGAFTPYLGISQVRSDSETSTPGIPTAGLPAPYNLQAMTLNAYVNALLQKAAEDQHSWTAGVRWDFRKNMDLKLQYDHIQLQRGSNGTFANIQSGFQRDGSVHLVSASLDFIF